MERMHAPVFRALSQEIIWAFITDVIDDQEVKTNKREDGTIYAVYSFARKLGQAFAGGRSFFNVKGRKESCQWQVIP